MIRRSWWCSTPAMTRPASPTCWPIGRCGSWGRLRSDRVLLRPAPPPVRNRGRGRRPKHGAEFVFGDPATWGAGHVATRTDTRLYGTATAQAWNRLHPRLTRRAAWVDHDGPLPVIEGTVIRLMVEHLPSGGVNKPVWLWCSDTDAGPAEVDRYWQMFLRRFDIEHTFRLLKQTPSAGPGPDCAARGRRPLDLADPRGPRPTASGPPTGRRPAPPLGTTRRTRQAYPGTRPTRISQPPLEDRMSSSGTEIHPTGPVRPPGSKNRVTAQRFDVGLHLATGQAYT